MAPLGLLAHEEKTKDEEKKQERPDRSLNL